MSQNKCNEVSRFHNNCFFAICHSVWGLVTVRVYLYVIRVNFSLYLIEKYWSFFYQYECEVEQFTISLMHSNELNWILLTFSLRSKNAYKTTVKNVMSFNNRNWWKFLWLLCKWFFITFSGCMYYFRNPDPFCALSLSLNKCINNLASHIGPLPI